MIEVEIVDAYSGGIYNKVLKRYIASSFNDVLKYINKLNKNKFNTSHRVIIHADKGNFDNIPLFYSDNKLDDIDSIMIMYTIDMCTIIEKIYIHGYEYDNDLFIDSIDLEVNDIVYNKLDGKYYLVVKDPNKFSLNEALWNDDSPVGLLSRYDIHKVSKHEYEYYNLNRLEMLRNANSEEEYNMILDETCENHPRLMNYDTNNKSFIDNIAFKFARFKNELYTKKLKRYKKKK